MTVPAGGEWATHRGRPNANSLLGLRDGRPEVPATREMARLGWRYVIAGSSLGARVLLRRAEALGFTDTHGASYLALHARGDAWRTLLATLESLRLNAAEETTACEGANEAFQCVEQCLDAARTGLAA